MYKDDDDADAPILRPILTSADAIENITNPMKSTVFWYNTLPSPQYETLFSFIPESMVAQFENSLFAATVKYAERENSHDYSYAYTIYAELMAVGWSKNPDAYEKVSLDVVKHQGTTTYMLALPLTSSMLRQVNAGFGTPDGGFVSTYFAADMDFIDSLIKAKIYTTPVALYLNNRGFVQEETVRELSRTHILDPVFAFGVFENPEQWESVITALSGVPNALFWWSHANGDLEAISSVMSSGMTVNYFVKLTERYTRSNVEISLAEASSLFENNVDMDTIDAALSTVAA